MTQIFNLPQIDGTRTTFVVAKDSVFQFSIPFPYPAGPQLILVAACAMTAGSPTLANLPAETVSSLVTGQPVAGYGIPVGTTIVAIPTTTSVTLSSAATQSGASIGVSFQPLPLDLTGISFLMQVRRVAGDEFPLLIMSTDNGLLINGGTSGVLAINAPPSALAGLPLSTAAMPLVTDISATASDGGPINLMAQSGPASVVVQQAVSRP
ncbi:hypothetical protein SB2_11855 [Methylobacterium radiotolerans]|nr:hypothetical protein SB3_11050 [Methylobacterium radiotolerans]KTS47986.1 hypothetical protein SB2_11855 [Methylobacterium radiotolerans]